MRVVFCGSGEFALPSLHACCQSGHEILAVITQPARRAGRGGTLRPTPVALAGGELDLPVIECADINAADMVARLKEMRADAMIVVDFGQMIRLDARQSARLDVFNLHASLLPELRGAAPVNWAIMRGYRTTGVTTFSLVDKMDAGDIYLQLSTDIDPHETAQELKTRLAKLGSHAVVKTLEMLAVRTIEEGRIGRSLAHHARAMCLYPMPYFKKVAALLRQAGMGVVSDPHTGPLHARVKELLAEGNLVCLGQDDISDAYYPYGQNNMLEVAFLASHLLWMTTFPEMETLYDLITVQAATCINLPKFALKEKNNASLVVLDAQTVCEAFRYHRAPRHVISHGKLLKPGRIA